MKRASILVMAMAVMLSAVLWSCSGSNGSSTENSTVKWVDLDLPSGLLWAECNLGATKPEEYGNYYAWGETQPKEVYNWSTYCHSMVDSNGELQSQTKYNTAEKYGTIDRLTTLQPVDDAATSMLGNGARIPTAEDWRELIANTTSEWTTVNGVRGYKFTAPNGNSLFLPAAGYRWDGSLYGAGAYGFYWSSSLITDYPYYAWYCYFCSGYVGMDNDYRLSGHTVRAVRQN